jgi:hypothetical protein
MIPFHHPSSKARFWMAASLVCLAAFGDPVVAAPRALVASPRAPGRAVPGRVYKVVFDFNSPSVDGRPNPGLVALGALGDQYQGDGVAPSHRQFVVVLRRGYVDIALTDAAYRARHEGRANPDVPLVASLMKQGVRFVVPQAEGARAGVGQGDLQPGIDVGPTPDFLFINLEADGYVYTGTRSLHAD